MMSSNGYALDTGMDTLGRLVSPRKTVCIGKPVTSSTAVLIPVVQIVVTFQTVSIHFHPSHPQQQMAVNPFSPKSDQHQISPYSNNT